MAFSLSSVKTFASDASNVAKRNLKNAAVKGVSNAFGKSLVGRALGGAFVKAAKDKGERDTQVADALREQTTQEDTNNAVLTRMESIVMNISDNIYNIAGLWSDEVEAMKEARRVQEQQASREAAAREEADNEMLKATAPSPSGTESPKEKKGGLLGTLTGAIGSTKKLLRGFLGKFALVAGGLLAAGAASAYTADSANSSDIINEPSNNNIPTPLTEGVIPSTAEGGRGSAAAAAVDPRRTDAPASVQTINPNSELPPASLMLQSTSAPYESGAETARLSRQNVAAATQAPAATPVTAPAPAASLPTEEKDTEVEQLKDYFQKPENYADNVAVTTIQQRINVIKKGIASTKGLLKVETDPTLISNHTAALAQMEASLEAAQKAKKEIVDRGKEAVSIQPRPAMAGPEPQTAPGVGGAPPSMGGGSIPSSSGGSSGATMIGATGGESAAPVMAAPSSGSDVGTASVNVAAANEATTNTNQTMSIDTSGPPPSNDQPLVMLSPIADRGSLDIGTTFNSGQ